MIVLCNNLDKSIIEISFIGIIVIVTVFIIEIIVYILQETNLQVINLIIIPSNSF